MDIHITAEESAGPSPQEQSRREIEKGADGLVSIADKENVRLGKKTLTSPKATRVPRGLTNPSGWTRNSFTGTSPEFGTEHAEASPCKLSQAIGELPVSLSTPSPLLFSPPSSATIPGSLPHSPGQTQLLLCGSSRAPKKVPKPPPPSSPRTPSKLMNSTAASRAGMYMPRVDSSPHTRLTSEKSARRVVDGRPRSATGSGGRGQVSAGWRTCRGVGGGGLSPIVMKSRTLRRVQVSGRSGEQRAASRSSSPVGNRRGFHRTETTVASMEAGSTKFNTAAHGGAWSRVEAGGRHRDGVGIKGSPGLLPRPAQGNSKASSLGIAMGNASPPRIAQVVSTVGNGREVHRRLKAGQGRLGRGRDLLGLEVERSKREGSCTSSSTSASIPSVDETDRTPTLREYTTRSMRDPVSFILQRHSDAEEGQDGTWDSTWNGGSCLEGKWHRRAGSDDYRAVYSEYWQFRGIDGCLSRAGSERSLPGGGWALPQKGQLQAGGGKGKMSAELFGEGIGFNKRGADAAWEDGWGENGQRFRPIDVPSEGLKS